MAVNVLCPADKAVTFRVKTLVLDDAATLVETAPTSFTLPKALSICPDWKTENSDGKAILLIRN
jgi:hypothetical protein